VLVDIGRGRLVSIARIRDKDGQIWLGLKQVQTDLLPAVSRSSIIYSFKNSGEPCYFLAVSVLLFDLIKDAAQLHQIADPDPPPLLPPPLPPTPFIVNVNAHRDGSPRQQYRGSCAIKN